MIKNIKINNRKALLISISGIRGVWEETLRVEDIFRFGKAFIEFLKRGQRARQLKIILARDTRKNGFKIKKNLLKILGNYNIKIFDLGICPTPVVLWMVKKLRADGGIVITASHNPQEWNGFKFIGPDGFFLDKKNLQKLIQIQKKGKLSQNNQNQPLKVFKISDQKYLKHLLKSLQTAKIRKQKFRVAIDGCNGAGSKIFPRFLRKLNCRVSSININQNRDFPHDPEPNQKSLKQLVKIVQEKKADIGFMLDPDGDRLAIVTENGEPVSEEIVLALAVKYVLKQKNGKVVINLSTSRMIDDIVGQFRQKIFKSAVGEINVVSGMKKQKAVIGGEGNGGVIYPKINFGRDSLVAAGLILEYMAKTQQKISQLIYQLPKYYIEKTKISYPKEKIKDIYTKLTKIFPGHTDWRDGLRIDMPDYWLHVRGSNTEPVVRIITEAKTKLKALKLNQKTRDLFKLS